MNWLYAGLVHKLIGNLSHSFTWLLLQSLLRAFNTDFIPPIKSTAIKNPPCVTVALSFGVPRTDFCLATSGSSTCRLVLRAQWFEETFSANSEWGASRQLSDLSLKFHSLGSPVQVEESQKPLWPYTCRIPVLKQESPQGWLHLRHSPIWPRGAQDITPSARHFKGALLPGSMTDWVVYWCLQMW